MSNIKIALTGKMRSGKDTVGAYLVCRHRFRAFALSEGIHEVCGLVGLIHPDSFIKPRAIIQGVGQDLRKYDEDVWVKYTLKKIEARALYENIVITDARQPNEVDTFKKMGFKLVRVNADPEIRINRMKERGEILTTEELNHETEQYVDKFSVDYEIYNNGSLFYLYREIDNCLSELNSGVFN